MTLHLPNRLQTAADLTRADRLTADVGTDHGYLPAFLVMSGKTQRAIASDIGKGPLANAEKTVKEYGLEKNIALILSDGLQNIPHETQEIVIAGMGGTLIAEILSAAPWVRNDSVHLVLQPMTHSYDVRKFLCENEFMIDTEKTCADAGRTYLVISAYFSGKNEEKDEFYYYFGDTVGAETETDRAYLQKQLRYLSSRYEGLQKTGNESEAAVFGAVLMKAKQREDWKDLW